MDSTLLAGCLICWLRNANLSVMDRQIVLRLHIHLALYISERSSIIVTPDHHKRATITCKVSTTLVILRLSVPDALAEFRSRTTTFSIIPEVRASVH